MLGSTCGTRGTDKHQNVGTVHTGFEVSTTSEFAPLFPVFCSHRIVLGPIHIVHKFSTAERLRTHLVPLSSQTGSTNESCPLFTSCFSSSHASVAGGHSPGPLSPRSQYVVIFPLPLMSISPLSSSWKQLNSCRTSRVAAETWIFSAAHTGTRISTRVLHYWASFQKSVVVLFVLEQCLQCYASV